MTENNRNSIVVNFFNNIIGKNVLIKTGMEIEKGNSDVIYQTENNIVTVLMIKRQNGNYKFYDTPSILSFDQKTIKIHAKRKSIPEDIKFLLFVVELHKDFKLSDISHQEFIYCMDVFFKSTPIYPLKIPCFKILYKDSIDFLYKENIDA